MATSVLPSPVTISAMLPAVQHHAADQLHVVMPHARKRRPASRQTAKASTSRSSSVSPAASRLRNLTVCSRNSYVGHRLVFRLQGVDRVDLSLHPFDQSRVGTAPKRRDRAFKAAQDPTEKRGEDIPNAFQDLHSRSFLKLLCVGKL